MAKKKQQRAKGVDQRTIRISQATAEKIEEIGRELADEMGLDYPVSRRQVADMLISKGIDEWVRLRRKG